MTHDRILWQYCGPRRIREGSSSATVADLSIDFQTLDVESRGDSCALQGIFLQVFTEDFQDEIAA